jgi:hypothetical protein
MEEVYDNNLKILDQRKAPTPHNIPDDLIKTPHQISKICYIYSSNNSTNKNYIPHIGNNKYKLLQIKDDPLLFTNNQPIAFANTYKIST